MPWTTDDIPSQRARVAVITGANGGLGLETSRELARKGAFVVMAARNQVRADEACRIIAADVHDARLEVRHLDLASLDSVRTCADSIVTDYGRINLLVNNAGLMAIPERVTADGFEMQLGVNHLGHFVLTRRLLPALLGASDARIVSVTSFARLYGRPLNPDNPHLHGTYTPWRAYNQSKLANLHFAVELQRRLQLAGAVVQSLAAHPGMSPTDLQERSVRETGGGLSQRFWLSLARRIGMPPTQAVMPQLRASTDLQARGGELYAPRWGTFGAPVRRRLFHRSLDPAATRTLWDASERETREVFNVGEIVSDVS